MSARRCDPCRTLLLIAIDSARLAACDSAHQDAHRAQQAMFASPPRTLTGTLTGTLTALTGLRETAHVHDAVDSAHRCSSQSTVLGRPSVIQHIGTHTRL